jgi:hypothetical protein
VSTDGQTTASSTLHKSQSDCDLRYSSLFFFLRQLTLVKQNRIAGTEIKQLITPVSWCLLLAR